MTATAEAVFGEERRYCFIRGREAHRELVPSINSKKDLAGLADLTLL